MYRYSKSRVTGIPHDELALLYRQLPAREFTDYCLHEAKERLKEMPQNFTMQDIYNSVDSEGVSIAELMQYRKKCIDEWEGELAEFR